MSQNYMGRSSKSLNKSAYSTSTTASSGRLVRQKQVASRFPPTIILGIVVSVGLILVGTVMTVIANMPGVTGTGYNMLKIMGPVIVAFGTLCVISIAIFAVMRNNNNREIWQKRMIDAERTKVWASRTTLESGMQFQGPNSNYGDSNVFEDRSFSGSQPRVNNVSYEQGNDASYGQHSVYKIQTIPDPVLAVHQANNRHHTYSRNHANRPQSNGRLSNGSAKSNNNNLHANQNQQANQHPSAGTGLNNSSASEKHHMPVPAIRIQHAPKPNSASTAVNQYPVANYSSQEPPLARSSPSSRMPEPITTTTGYPSANSYNTTPPKASSSPSSHSVPQYASPPAQLMATQYIQQVRSPRTPQYNNTRNPQHARCSPLIGMPDLGAKVVSF